MNKNYKPLTQKTKQLLKLRLRNCLESGEKKQMIKAQNLNEIAKKVKTQDIQPGDYVQVEGNDVRNLANSDKVFAMMKQKKNILYVYKVTPDGMVTLTPSRTVTTRKIQIPRSLIRYKLINVDQEDQ